MIAYFCVFQSDKIQLPVACFWQFWFQPCKPDSDRF